MYNFFHRKFHHRYFLFSLFFSILYLLINLALIGFVLFSAFKLTEPEKLQDNIHYANTNSNYYITHRKTQFIWRGLQLKTPHKLFHGLQYLHYAIFAFILVICYRNTDTQIIFNMINTLWFVGYVIALRPPLDTFW